MPSKKKKYNARFPAGRIKKIMQTDEEVGKVALAVPIIISRTLELFVESLLKKATQITNAKNAKTLSPSHMKQCILSESRFDFLKDLVEKIPDVSAAEEIFDPTIATEENVKSENSTKTTNTQSENDKISRKSHGRLSYGSNGNQNSIVDLTTRKAQATEIPHSSTGPNFYKELSSSPSVANNSVIQFSPKLQTSKPLSHSVDSIISHSSPKVPKLNISTEKNLNTSTERILNTSAETAEMQPVLHLDFSSSSSFIKCQDSTKASQSTPVLHIDLSKYNSENPPPLVPITDVNQVHPLYSIKFGTNNPNDELDEDYDN